MREFVAWLSIEILLGRSSLPDFALISFFQAVIFVRQDCFKVSGFDFPTLILVLVTKSFALFLWPLWTR